MTVQMTGFFDSGYFLLVILTSPYRLDLILLTIFPELSSYKMETLVFVSQVLVVT